MKYIEKINKFMYGRYGPDALFNFLFKLYIFLLIINIFIQNKILSIIELIIIFIIFYRFLSKKIYQRSNENQIFLKLKKQILKLFLKIKKEIKTKINNLKDKNYIYKKCHKCNTTLRLPIPNKYGIKHVKCPKCKKRLTVVCLKKEQIEIIKNNKRRKK